MTSYRTLALACTLAWTSGAWANPPVHTLRANAVGDGFGLSASGLGDVNGDGRADVVVGSPWSGEAGFRAGTVRIFSGADGSVLRTLQGTAANDEFGWAVSGAGDVDGDGVPDLIVGARYNDAGGVNSGAAQIFSGASGEVLVEFKGRGEYEQFGSSVASAGDVDGDGHPDVIIGAPRARASAADCGAARVYSGRSGKILHDLVGESNGDAFGHAVSGAGDVDGDGFADVIVGAPGEDARGSASGTARVYSGRDGSILHTFFGDSVVDNFGSAVGSAGDVNGDGRADLIVGAAHDDVKGPDSGTAWIFSGKDGSVLLTLHGESRGDNFGASVGSAGDVNGDGRADLVVGAPHDDNAGGSSGSVGIFSGKDGSVIASWNGFDELDEFGWTVSGVGDVDGDGVPDIVAAGPGRREPDGSVGTARVLSIPDQFPANPR